MAVRLDEGILDGFVRLRIVPQQVERNPARSPLVQTDEFGVALAGLFHGKVSPSAQQISAAPAAASVLNCTQST